MQCTRRPGRPFLTTLASALLLALGALGGGCSSSGSGSGAGGADAGCKQSLSGDCAWTPCQNSLADYCAARAATNNPCILDWPADPQAFCAGNTLGSLSTGECGGYRMLESHGVDAGSNYYYDAATGKLVAVVGYNANFETTRCLGGPADFVEPTSCSPSQLTCSAGVDAGDAGGAAGAGGVGGAAGAGGVGGADAGAAGGAGGADAGM